ncbi:Protein of unknown function [Spirosomataceae bacterium TFI 002]|nr:Protein of unknown function [Spirosomataceae bacterium TFI 002]
MQAIYSIEDDRFDITDLENKKLILEFQQGKFVFIVLNNITNSIEWLEDFPITEWENDLPIIFDNHQFLKANFWAQVVVVFHAIQKAIVPTKFIGKIDKSHLIPNYNSPDQNVEIKTFKINEERTLLYRVPKYFQDFLSKVYIGKEIYFIPMELCQPKENDGLIILVSNDACNFSTHNGSMINSSVFIGLRNTRHFEKCIDYFGEENAKVVLLGTVTNYSPLFDVIKRKDCDLSFGVLSSQVKFSQYFSEVPKHKYFTIFNSVLYF